MGRMRQIGCLLVLVAWAVAPAVSGEQPATPTRSLAEDASPTLRKRITDDVAKALRERFSAYSPVLDQVRKRSGDELQKLGQWEYKVVAVRASDPDAISAIMNQWGEQGWECFHVSSAAPSTAGSLPAQHLLFFRKPKGSWLGHLPARDLVRLIVYLWMQPGRSDSSP